MGAVTQSWIQLPEFYFPSWCIEILCIFVTNLKQFKWCLVDSLLRRLVEVLFTNFVRMGVIKLNAKCVLCVALHTTPQEEEKINAYVRDI